MSAPGDVVTDPRPASGARENVIHLRIPALSRYLRLARLTAVGMASDLGFRVDDLEDLRVAIDELCAAIIDGTPADGELDLTYREVNGGMVIEGHCVASTDNPPKLHDVAQELLTFLADEYAIGAAGRDRNFRLVKHVRS